MRYFLFNNLGSGRRRRKQRKFSHFSFIFYKGILGISQLIFYYEPHIIYFYFIETVFRFFGGFFAVHVRT